MAILLKPGQIVYKTLPSDADLPPEERGGVWLKVPDENDVRNLLRLDGRRNGQSLDGADYLRKKFGVFIDRVDRIMIVDVDQPVETATPLVIEKDREGALTPRCFAQLQALMDDFNELIDGFCKLSNKERKNS